MNRFYSMYVFAFLIICCSFLCRGFAIEKNNLLLENQCRILILRHGETEWNVLGKSQGWTDIPLNEEGRRQARVIAEQFVNLPIAKVYASSLSRALETAEIIAAPHHLLVQADPTLRFYKRGKTWVDYIKTKKMREAQMRKEITDDALAYLKNIAFHHPGELIVIVTHRSVVRHILEGLGGCFPKNRVAANVEVISVLGEDGFLFLEKVN